jgi:hypothetical protein
MYKKSTLMMFGMLLCSLPAFAAAPLITDDTGTQGKGKYQFELDYAAGIPQVLPGREIAATLTWGVVDNVDVIMTLPYDWHTGQQEGVALADQQGISDVLVDVKWRFFESKVSGLSFALRPGFSIPTGSEANGFGNGRISEGIMFLATKDWEHGALHGNFGYFHDAYSFAKDNESFRHDLWHASFAAELKMMENLRSLADIGVDTNIVKAADINPVYLIVGLIYRVTENFDLDMGVKSGLNNAIPKKTFLTGLSARF